MTKRRYEHNFKMEAIKLVESGRKATEVSRDLDIPIQTLTKWLSKYREGGEASFVGSGKLTPVKQTEVELQKRLKELEEENRILKKANAHLCQRPEIIYEFIYQHRHEFRVTKMCKVLGVSKSGYYDWKKRPASSQQKRRDRLKKEIYKVYIGSQKRYGSPKITKELMKEGIKVSQRTVTRLMKEMGIRSITKKKYKATTDSKHNLPIYPNLLNQRFKVEKPGVVWVSDITYIYTREGWVYLATVMDLFSRRIIGWSMSNRMTKDLVISALERAFTAQKPTAGLIHHSDRGSQYASIEYQNILRENEIITSMSRKGNCYDNACIESFHSIIKKELIHHCNFQTRNEAMFSIIEYIVTFYNSKRIHSTLNYLSPLEFEKMFS
ncbi:IS3 family transposase [Staphylococcus lutrae]